MFCLCQSCPSWPTSLFYFYSFIFSPWAQGERAMLPTRLLSAHAQYAAPLRLPVSVLLRRLPGAAWVPTGSRGDPPPPRSRVANRTGRGSRSCRHGPPWGHRPGHLRRPQHRTWEMFFFVPSGSVKVSLRCQRGRQGSD